MLIFIVPLKSKRVSKDWLATCHLLERTLRSICNQTNSSFQVKVICNEKPEITLENSQIQYHSVDFSLPESTLEKERDKARKMWAGLQQLDYNLSSHIMFVDADDCVSNQLAELVHRNPTHNGWFLNSGYEWQEGSQRVFLRRRDFQNKTNTSHILNCLMLKKYAQYKFEEINHDFLFHKLLREIADREGYFLQSLKFPGAIYVTDHGENMYTQRATLLESKLTPKQMLRVYGGMIYKPFFTRSLTTSICSEFGLALEA